jgi:hypothetical protein
MSPPFVEIVDRCAIQDLFDPPLQAPEIPGQLSKTYHNFVACNVDIKKAGAYIVHAEPGIVEVIYGKGLTDWLLGAALQALRPEAKLTVAVGHKVNQTAIRRPSRLIVPPTRMINRDPIILFGSSVDLQRHYEKPATYARPFRMTGD